MRLLISTGEVSGDLQGSLLIKALYREAERRSLPLELFALGGLKMKEAGAELIANTASIGAIGLIEALPQVIPTLKAQRLVDQFLKEKSIDGVVLIDYMGPNIRLGNKLKKLDKKMPIIYYIAPQEWAWRLGDGGTTDLISFSDKILAIFKEEAEFYSSRGGDVTWVGHPMIDTFQSLPNREDSFNKLGLDLNDKIMLLLPASRKQELKFIMPVLAKAAALIQKAIPGIKFLVPCGVKNFEEPIQKILKKYDVSARVISEKETNLLRPYIFAAADLALSKSGTINMELALNNVPQIVGYKVSPLTAFIAKKLLRFRVEHISPVNLLLKERLVPELVQEDFNPHQLAELSVKFLRDSCQRNNILEGYLRLRNVLGETGVTDRAARQIFNLVEK